MLQLSDLIVPLFLLTLLSTTVNPLSFGIGRRDIVKSTFGACMLFPQIVSLRCLKFRSLTGAEYPLEWGKSAKTTVSSDLVFTNNKNKSLTLLLSHPPPPLKNLPPVPGPTASKTLNLQPSNPSTKTPLRHPTLNLLHFIKRCRNRKGL